MMTLTGLVAPIFTGVAVYFFLMGAHFLGCVELVFALILWAKFYLEERK